MNRLAFGLLLAAIAAGCGSSRDEEGTKNAVDGVNPEKSVSAGGGRARRDEIVFGSNRGGVLRIWSILADGSDLQQIVECENDDESDRTPRYSPDGRRILFTSNRGGSSAIWTVNADGSAAEKVCDGSQGDWSADGLRMSFVRDGRVWVRDLKTGRNSTVVPNDFTNCAGPVFTPDSKMLVFSHRVNGTNGLYAVGVAGDVPPAKVYEGKDSTHPQFSPDGRLLSFEADGHICIMKHDAAQNDVLTYWGGIQKWASWSPDGTKIVYCQSSSVKGPWELYVVPVSGGSPAKLTNEGSDMSPCWSPVRD